jgi:purine nucleosidase
MHRARRPILIDTDTASDDAVALLMALRHPGVEVLAITVVAGNVPLDQAVQNALYVVELAGADVAVHAGRAAPLLIPLRTAQFVHGQDGMGDIGLPVSGRVPAPGDAVDVLVDTIRRSEPGTLTLVTLGPLTNVAVAFTRDPSLATHLREIVVMGGTADAVGNVSAVAEFNIWVDPEAAAIVYGSGARITQVGWDISRKYATITKGDAADLRALGSLGSFVIDINGVVDTFATEKTGLDGFDLPDPIAMAVALDDDVATDTRLLNVMVETGGSYTAGQTVVDHLGISGRAPNVHVVVEASRAAFLRVLHETLDEREGSRS